MAHIQVEASVRTHAKFLKAGPAASWLWLCGMGYCQDGLTDGFIPKEALDYLGVKKPAALKDRLVAVDLWEVVPGGWKVHDYLEHNRSSSTIRVITQHKRDAGKAGGLASGEARREALASQSATAQPEAVFREPEAASEPISSHLISSHLNSDHLISKQERELEPLDVAFSAFREKYPSSRRKGGPLVEQAFMRQSVKAGGSAVLMAALENHLISEQWQSSKHIPGMDVWLDEERWRQTLEPPVSKPAGVYANWRPR